jgi:hypothetical protein
MTPVQRKQGGRMAPLCIALLLAAGLSAGVAAAERDFAVAVAASAGAEIVALDDRFAEAGRVVLGAPLAALAVFDPAEGRAYAAMRDGRVLKVDLRRGEISGEARVGGGASAIVASSDGRYLAIAVASPPSLVVLDRNLRVERKLPALDVDGRRTSAVAAVIDMPNRRSFLAALPGLPEVWEVSYDDAAPPIFPGLVHDYRFGEAIAVPGKLNPRRVPLEAPVDDLFADPGGADVLGSAYGSSRVQVLNLHVRRRIAIVDATAAASASARWAGVVAVPHGEALRLVDARTWRVLADLPLGGTVTRVRAHNGSPHAWVVVRDAADAGDRLLRFDRERQRASGEVALPAQARVVDVAFAAAGAEALVLLDGPEPGLVRVDAGTLEPKGRIALPAPTALAVPAQRRTATSK